MQISNDSDLEQRSTEGLSERPFLPGMMSSTFLVPASVP